MWMSKHSCLSSINKNKVKHSKSFKNKFMFKFTTIKATSCIQCITVKVQREVFNFWSDNKRKKKYKYMFIYTLKVLCN